MNNNKQLEQVEKGGIKTVTQKPSSPMPSEGYFGTSIPNKGLKPMTKLEKRVKEIIKQNGFDIKDPLIIQRMVVVYAQAQIDYLREQLKIMN